MQVCRKAVRADVVRVPFGDVSALDRAARDAGSSLAAIVLEPVVEHEPPRGLARACARTVRRARRRARV